MLLIFRKSEVIGHAIEPVPPGILAPTFAPLDTAKVSDLPKLAASMFAGYFAECRAAMARTPSSVTLPKCRLVFGFIVFGSIGFILENEPSKIW